ncbi:hypothetical protein [Treponema lecithinolyticum]|uniref:hypothetical protein n=1 Tax=Treponema lecithinolyticum TaxID=53418 RepID=UPI0012ECB65D|nr:hypothetical protein [Treponema lecithinolyticum]
MGGNKFILLSSFKGTPVGGNIKRNFTIKCFDLSATQEKMIKRFGSFDSDSESYKLPAILIAQLGRNFSSRGTDLMIFVLDNIVYAKDKKELIQIFRLI